MGLMTKITSDDKSYVCVLYFNFPFFAKSAGWEKIVLALPIAPLSLERRGSASINVYLISSHNSNMKTLKSSCRSTT